MSDQSPIIKVTIEIEGPADEVSAWLSQLPTGMAQKRRFTTTKQPTEEWTPERAEELVHQISSRAREALRVIARGAPAISFDDVRDALGVKGEGLGGTLASFGFAERRGFAKPYYSDRDKRVFRMDPVVAETLLEALGYDSG